MHWCSQFCPLNRGVHCGEVYIKTTEHNKYTDLNYMWSVHDVFESYIANTSNISHGG